MTPLHMAVKGSHKNTVDYLIGKDASVNIKDSSGVSMQNCTTENILVPGSTVVHMWEFGVQMVHIFFLLF